VRREVDFLDLGPSLYSIVMQTHSYEMVIEERDGEYEVLLRGRLYSGEVLDERAQLLRLGRSDAGAEGGEISIKAPMPGLVVALPLAEGAEVVSGQTVVILESMKMQNELKAPRDGVIQRISVQVGQSVEQGKLLVTLV
jgi:biotin carboxyl carrier protein